MKRLLLLLFAGSGIIFAQALNPLSAVGPSNSIPTWENGTGAAASAHTLQVNVYSPAVCTIKLQGSNDNVTFFDISTVQSCTTSTSFSVTGQPYNYVRAYLVSYSGDLNGATVKAIYTGSSYVLGASSGVASFSGLTGNPADNANLATALSFAVNAKTYGAKGDDTTDDTTAIQNAMNSLSSTGGTVWLPPATYKITTLTLVSGVSLVGASPQVTAPANQNPDQAYAKSADGTWLDCSASASCITGNTLRSTNLEHIGFTNWTGKAILIGGNNLDGISFANWADLQFIGGTTVNTSDQAVVLYNFQHLVINGLRAIWVNVGLNLINQSQYIQGGNSEITGFYVHTYSKSAANGNATEPGLWLQTLTPSSGTAFPLSYVTLVRPQVNSYLGDGTGMNVQITGLVSAASEGHQIIGLDLEGTYFKGVDLVYTGYSTINIAALDRVSSNACASASGSCDVYQENGSFGNTISSSQPITEFAYSAFSFGEGARYAVSSSFNQSYGTLVDSGTNVVSSRVNGSLTVTPNGNGQEQHASIGCATSYGTTTLSLVAVSTTTAVNCLPANAVIDAITYRVTTAITGAATFTIGDGSTAARFCGTQSGITAGSTGVCLAQRTSSSEVQISAAPIVVTFNTTPTAGVMRIIVYYHTWNAPGF